MTVEAPGMVLEGPHTKGSLQAEGDRGMWGAFQAKKEDIQGNKLTTQNETLRIQSQRKGSRET